MSNETQQALKCMACGHKDAQHKADEAADACWRCDECGARMAYGKLLPRVVVEPFTDSRGHTFIRQRFQDPRTKQDLFVFDGDLATAVLQAKNLLALVQP